MTSDFDAFIGGAFDDAAALIGEVTFTIQGVKDGAALKQFTGVLDRKAKADDREGGGFVPDANATLVAKRTQFAADPIVGRDCTVEGDTFTIADFEKDTISYTLHLRLPVAKR